MKILVWEHKHGCEQYDASTEEKEEEAALKIFRQMLDTGDYECCEPEGAQIPLFEKAKAGIGRAALQFLLVRSASGYEYETVYIDTVRD